MPDELVIRLARRADVRAIRDLLADDVLGAAREDTSEEGLQKYLSAFEQIEGAGNNELYVAEQSGRVVGTFQLTFIPYLSRGGNLRAHIEAVRVATEFRDRGIGGAMMRFALERAREKGCLLAQLTTDRTREEAHRFYRRLGFESTHHGMKMKL